MTSSDRNVAVIGGGTMGSMIGWRLAKRGVQTTVFEQFSPGHDRSAAGGETRIFRTAYVEGPRYIPILRLAHELWRELEDAAGRTLLQEVGVLTLGDQGSASMQNALKGIEQFGLNCKVLNSGEIRERFPQHAIANSDSAILDPTGGFLRPELSVATAASVSEDLGAEIHRYARVERIESRNDGVLVRVNGDEYRFDSAVVAAGPWTDRLLPAFNSVVEVQRRLQAWFLPYTPEIWFDRDCPVFMRTGEGERYYGIPSVDGISVKVGVTGELDDRVRNPDALNRTVDVGRLDTYRKVISTYLPDLMPDPIRLGAYQEGYTPDRHAVLGFMPGLENVIAVAGFSGHGFKFSPAVGEIVADLVLYGRTALDVSHMDPCRFDKLAKGGAG